MMKSKLKPIDTLKCLLLTIGILVSSVVLGQTLDSIQLPKPINRATLIGIGSADLYDTYLSPLKYKGTSFRILHERMSRTSWFDKRFYKQQTFNLEFASTDNPAKTASELWLLADYKLGGHYQLIEADRFRFRAGGLWNIAGGVLYNERNGNNPASARAYTNLNLSAIAFYDWKIFTFRWQIDTPFMGMMFSPRYGQSYYEISLGNSVGVVNFSSLHNQRALRNYITVDVPVYKFTIRAGYLGSLLQTKIHNIQTHTYTHSFVLGIATESISISGAKTKKKANWDSSYY